MNSIDDITLMAYVDGELDPVTCAEVEALLAKNQELRRKVRGLRESTALVRSAFNHILYNPMPEFNTGRERVVVPLNDFAGKGRKRVQNWWPRTLPLAATLAALVVGASLGHYLTERDIARELRNAGLSVSLADEAAIQKALMQGLEKELSGTRVAWSNPDTGHQGAIVPIRTFQSETGQYCREFMEFRKVAGSTYDQGGVACRHAEGIWKVRIRYLPENGGV
ncbi:MAG: RT0821/Lpp0805 family surface protein [Candidatus Competibacteraceae bacterium]